MPRHKQFIIKINILALIRNIKRFRKWWRERHEPFNVEALHEYYIQKGDRDMTCTCPKNQPTPITNPRIDIECPQHGWVPNKDTCKQCGGAGVYYIQHTCEQCNGTGIKKEDANETGSRKA